MSSNFEEERKECRSVGRGIRSPGFRVWAEGLRASEKFGSSRSRRQFPKIWGTVFWGPYNRILLCRVLYLGPLFSETPIKLV